jgi:hypothetical protein
LVVAKVRERLAVGKRAVKKMDMYNSISRSEMSGK